MHEKVGSHSQSFPVCFFLFSRNWVQPDVAGPARDSLRVRMVKDGLTNGYGRLRDLCIAPNGK
ncbi:hypothetical protein [Spirosoma utsteinense]|uniref:Uncharacterized protein n=1 Tax=Spirosoma utsteinense TaxID=2585773 RepID=A0ABR6W6A8_9BACT|nr:hypothetical protein [Spirosoma utsteinense]MBC3787100.1 hypothetical protein [Spirosoma utsteinense]MBC3791350.1 hypothetical protein [Spirosoma utsteinense]